MSFHHFFSENDLHVKSSTDTTSSKQDSKDLTGSVSITMYGGGSGLGATLGYGEGHQNSDSTTNTNSELLAKNITIETSNDASFKGATVKADDTLNVKVGGDLSVESQRDSSSSNSKGFNVSVSGSLGKDKDYTSGSAAQQGALNNSLGARTGSGLGSTGASFGANTGTSQSKQTVLTSLTGENVNVEVEGNTHIKGALIAAGATNAQGEFEDNGNLKLKTDTLTFANSSNTQYSSSNSFNVGTNIGYGDTKDAKPSTTPAGKDEPKSDTKINSSSLSLSTQMGYSGSKTLATVGQGNLEVGDKENSDDLTRLNRDTSKVNKELYAGSVGTSVTAVLDHRLLTEEGRNQIKEDVKKASNAFSAMGDAITKDEVGLKYFFEHQGVVDATYEAMKQFIQTEDGKYAKIWNDQANATPEQLQEATNAFSKVIAYQYNISLDEAKLIAVDSFIKGANYNQPATNTIVINANGNTNALDYAETGTHEGTHAAINQGAISNRETSELNEAYAKLMEGYGSKDFVFVYTNAGYGDVKTDNVNKPIAQGDSAIIDKNTNWFMDKALNDPLNVDYRVVVYSRPVVDSLGITMNHLFGVVDQRENGEPSKIFSLSGNGVMMDGGTPTIYIEDLANVNADKNSKSTLEKDKGYLVDGFKEAQVIQVPKGVSQAKFDNIVLENAKSYNILTNQYPTISQTINAVIEVLFGSNNNLSSEYRNSNTYIDNVIEQSGGKIKDFQNAVLQNSGETSEKDAKETAKKLNISDEKLEKEIKQYQGFKGESK